MNISIKYLIAGLLCLVPMASWGATNINQNSFGFLSGDMDDDNFEYLESVGAGWMRPHPGPAVWQLIQPKNTSRYDWDSMDEVVTKAQEHDISLLMTIWPFANWDQVGKDNAERCRVVDTDQFLPHNKDQVGRYIPRYRCNPHDWNEYQRWIRAMVERYDGDGKRDMPTLTAPIRHWEVMNEPDLPGSETLDFYKDGVDEYYTLLRRTALTVRAADPKAKIVIAGAAGGSTEQAGYFLNFYQQLFSEHPKSKKYFDIGNVHHISPEGDGDFNVAAYRAVLREFDMKKPIWVTEAGAAGVTDPAEQKRYVRSNTREAVANGVGKIFYIHYSFDGDGKNTYKRSKQFYKAVIDKWTQ